MGLTKVPRSISSRPETTHKNSDGELEKEWTQRAMSVSRVMQVWRDQVVRDRMLEDEASTPFLLRKHHRIRETGFAHAAQASAAATGMPASVYNYIKDLRDNA